MNGTPVIATRKEHFALPASDSAAYAKLRSAGRISFLPERTVSADGTTYVHFSDGKIRTIDAAGTIHNINPRKRTSKKARRKLRKEKLTND